MKKFLTFLGTPAFLRAFHGWATVFWVPFTILAFFVGWLALVIFVSVVSMVALFLGSFSAWQAARTEELQEKTLMELKEILTEIKAELDSKH